MSKKPNFRKVVNKEPYHFTEEGQLVITDSCDLREYVYEHDGSLPIIVKNIRRGKVIVPQVINNGKLHNGIGVICDGIESSRIEGPLIRGFGVGVKITSTLINSPRVGLATVHSIFDFYHLDNNKVNQLVVPEKDGWCNSNIYSLSTKYSHNSDNPVESEEFKHVEVRNESKWYGVDNCLWINPSWEGSSARYMVEAELKDSMFIMPRYEKAKYSNKEKRSLHNPTVKFTGNSKRNVSISGFHQERVTFIQDFFGKAGEVYGRSKISISKYLDTKLHVKVRTLLHKLKKKKEN